MNDAFVEYSIMELLRGIHDRDVQTFLFKFLRVIRLDFSSIYCYYPFSVSCNF